MQGIEKKSSQQLIEGFLSREIDLSDRTRLAIKITHSGKTVRNQKRAFRTNFAVATCFRIRIWGFLWRQILSEPMAGIADSAELGKEANVAVLGT